MPITSATRAGAGWPIVIAAAADPAKAAIAIMASGKRRAVSLITYLRSGIPPVVTRSGVTPDTPAPQNFSDRGPEPVSQSRPAHLSGRSSRPLAYTMQWDTTAPWLPAVTLIV